MSFRPLPAEHVGKPLDHILAGFGFAAPVMAGDRAYHQALALQCAQQVGASYSRKHKEKARRECLGHLRASLARPPVAAGESAQQYTET